MIIEEDTDGFIRQLETKAIFVGVVNPLGNEGRPLLAHCNVGVVPGRHHVEGVEDGLVQGAGPGLQFWLLGSDWEHVAGVEVRVGLVLLLVRQGEAEH